MGQRRSHNGFTLLELLAVVAIIGLVVALLLPAIQASRESAHRLQCINHLKQIGLAFQTYYSVHNSYPTGGWEWWTPPVFEGSTPVAGEKQPASWAFQILPFLEEDRVATGAVGDTPEAKSIWAVGALIPVYFCPSRRDPQKIAYTDSNYMGGRKVDHGLIDYAGSNLDGTGVIRQEVAIRQSNVTDGLSSTMLVGEKRLNIKFLGQWQEDDNEGYTAGWDEDTMRKTSLGPRADYRGEGDGEDRFGSSHPQAFNVVLGDGSVHSLSLAIDEQVFNNLGAIDDGKLIPPLD